MNQFFKITFLFLLLSNSIFSFAQAPQAFSYQAVARDASGAILAQQSVAFRISILQNSGTGTVVYSETHSAITNDFGLVNLKVGMGTLVSGSFASIAWGGNNHFLRIEMDPAGGTAFQLMGTTQLLSVPYALYAESSGSSSGLTIISTVDNGDGTFTFIYSDNSTFTTSDLTGPAGSTGATGPAGTTGQNATDAYGTAQITATVSMTTYTLIPGLTQTITVPANAKVYVSTCGGVQCAAAGNVYAAVNIGIHVDNVVSTQGGQRQVVAANTTGLGNMLTSWSIAKTFTLSAGVHTIDVRVQDAGGTADANVSGTNALIQGVLTVIIIKQ